MTAWASSDLKYAYVIVSFFYLAADLFIAQHSLLQTKL